MDNAPEGYVTRCLVRWLPRRLHIAWHFRTWPWEVPKVTAMVLRPPCSTTHADLARGAAIARERGWLDG